MGASYYGATQWLAATESPPALKAIITLCSTDDRYADDIHYKGGCLLNENLGWSATMLAYSSRPPDPAIVGERWRAMHVTLGYTLIGLVVFRLVWGWVGPASARWGRGGRWARSGFG